MLESNIAKLPKSSDQKDELNSFGLEIRQLRKARGYTLKELASITKISLSHLSAIERDAVSPSLDKVAKIAEALNVSEDWFFTRREGSGPMERSYVVRSRNRRCLNTLYGESVEEIGYFDELLSSSIGGEFYMGVAQYSPFSDRPAHTMYKHSGEQHGMILDGELELIIGDETISLKQGDSYSFPANILHKARNVTDKPCRLVWATSPVIIPKDVIVQGNQKPSTDDQENYKSI